MVSVDVKHYVYSLALFGFWDFTSRQQLVCDNLAFSDATNEIAASSQTLQFRCSREVEVPRPYQLIATLYQD